MNALVTGATGFVGTHLVRALERSGWLVTALVRSQTKAAKRLGPKVVIALGDLTESTVMQEACRGQDVIFHLAGLVAARTEAEFDAVNRGGTERLLRAATRVGVHRFVLVSSLAAGGPSRPGIPQTGGEASRPVTAYGRSKLAAEDVVRRGEIPWIILRPPMVYGPFDTELLKGFRTIRSGIAPVFGDGSQELSAVYGPDLADALVAVGNETTTEGDVFYPSHRDILTSRDLMLEIARTMARKARLLRIPRWAGTMLLHGTGTLARLAGRATILNADKAHEFFAPAWTCDPTPLTAATGWTATHDLRSGLAATHAWYRTEGWL